MGGVLGMDWRPFTHKVLWIMYQAKIQDAYDHTSRLMMMSSMGKKPSTYFHPFRKGDSSTDKTQIKSNNIQDLAIFL